MDLTLPASAGPRVAVITCAVVEMEVRALAGGDAHIEVLPQGLHNTPPELRRRVQEAVERVEEMPQIEVIALGYGLCSRGIEGVRARRCTLVVARAHDCITLLLGDRRRYADYVRQHPGTYWYSPGWNLHHIPPGKQRYDLLRSEYAAKYGEDNADYLMETEQQWFKAYNRATYVDLGIGDSEADVSFTRQCAQWLGWTFDRQQGCAALMQDLLHGPWDEDRFLVLKPGQTARMVADDRVMEAVE